MSILTQVLVLVIMAVSLAAYRIKRALFGPGDWLGESEKRADEWRSEGVRAVGRKTVLSRFPHRGANPESPTAGGAYSKRFFVSKERVMLSYQNFTPIERESMVIALERQREKIQELINAVAVDSFEFTITPAEARQLVALVRPYYMPIAHEIEDHPGYEPE